MTGSWLESLYEKGQFRSPFQLIYLRGCEASHSEIGGAKQIYQH